MRVHTVPHGFHLKVVIGIGINLPYILKMMIGTHMIFLIKCPRQEDATPLDRNLILPMTTSLIKSNLSAPKQFDVSNYLTFIIRSEV